MNVNEYRTVAGRNWTELDTEVNRLIQEGFQPYGSPYYIGYGGIEGRLCQAMVKTKEGPTEQEKKAFVETLSRMRSRSR